MFTKSLIVLAALLAVVTVRGQENRKFEKHGIEFEYGSSWELKEKAAAEADEVALSNMEADAQITVIAVRKKLDGRDLAEAAKKQVVDPWLTSLVRMYAMQNITVQRTDKKFDVAGVNADGVQLRFDYGGEMGQVDAYWVVFEKKLVLVYMVRPDKKADKALAGWDLVRQTLKADEAKQ